MDIPSALRLRVENSNGIGLASLNIEAISKNTGAVINLRVETENDSCGIALNVDEDGNTSINMSGDDIAYDAVNSHFNLSDTFNLVCAKAVGVIGRLSLAIEKNLTATSSEIGFVAKNNIVLSALRTLKIAGEMAVTIESLATTTIKCRMLNINSVMTRISGSVSMGAGTLPIAHVGSKVMVMTSNGPAYGEITSGSTRHRVG